MLKYFPGYMAEYYLMYEHLFDEKFLSNTVINILSLGCGCGVDYWGFHFAATKKVKNHQKSSSYTGYDIIDWEYRDSMGHDKHVFFETEDIGNLKKLDYDKYNIIVFPKSISDFPDEVFATLLKAIENTKFKKKKIAILCSFMTNDSKKYDFNRLTRLVKVFEEQHGYKCLDKANEYFHMKDKDVGLNTVVPGFDYTLPIKKTIFKTLENCPNFIENGKSCDQECSNMNQYPILKTKYVNYAIRRLKKDQK